MSRKHYENSFQAWPETRVKSSKKSRAGIAGRPGLISPDALSRELAKSPDDLQYVVIKNSWGTDLQSPLLPLPGFHTIYQSYLRELAKKTTSIAIVVPRDIAFQVRYN